MVPLVSFRLSLVWRCLNLFGLVLYGAVFSLRSVFLIGLVWFVSFHFALSLLWLCFLVRCCFDPSVGVCCCFVGALVWFPWSGVCSVLRGAASSCLVLSCTFFFMTQSVPNWFGLAWSRSDLPCSCDGCVAWFDLVPDPSVGVCCGLVVALVWFPWSGVCSVLCGAALSCSVLSCTVLFFP